MSQVSKTDKYAYVSIKEGTNQHGYNVLDVVFKELSQLDDNTIFNPQEVKELLIGVHEGRDGSISDVVGAYILAVMEDYVLVKLGK